MFDTTSISVLLKILVIAVVGGIVTCRTYWDEPRTAIFAVAFTAFVAGACSATAYILIRYRRELTPGESQ